MTQRTKTHERKSRPFSASSILESIADDLSAIKKQDRLTFKQIAEVIGKSEDQAAKYCLGDAEMGVIAYARAKRQWNGRFTGSLDELCEQNRTSVDCDRVRHSKVLRAALALAEALEDDGEVNPGEVRDNRKELEDARDALDELLRRVVRAA